MIIYWSVINCAPSFISKVVNYKYITIANIIVVIACFIIAKSKTVSRDDQEAVAGAYLNKKLTTGSESIAHFE